MSAPDRRAMVERSGDDLSARRQCALVGVARSGIHRPRPVAGADDPAVMRRIDEGHFELPFHGSRPNDLRTQLGSGPIKFLA